MPSVLTGAERELYCTAFRARGMTGPTNYYRTTPLRGAEEAGASLALPHIPVLALHGTRDASLAPAALVAQRRAIPQDRLTECVLMGSGHWVMAEDAARSTSRDPTTQPSQSPGADADTADPLAPWRAAVSAGAWKSGTGDGGAVGRAVLEWLAGAGITAEGRERERARL